MVWHDALAMNVFHNRFTTLDHQVQHCVNVLYQLRVIVRELDVFVIARFEGFALLVCESHCHRKANETVELADVRVVSSMIQNDYGL